MFTKVSIVALFASLAAAQHAPVGNPSGNPITRPLNEIVPACKPFTITWQPTTTNTVSLILLRGPSTNVVPIGAPIVVGIPNSGSYTWTPGSQLEADTSRYGLQLIDDVNGQYQYSTQFGISKDACVASSSSVVVPSTSSSSAAATSSSAAGYGYPIAPSSTPIYYPTTTLSKSVAPVTSVAATSYAVGTGAPIYNSTVLQPSKSLSIPASLRPSATSNGTVVFTGAADATQAGLTFVGAFAALAYLL